MCLDTMDQKPKKHKFGFKICKKDGDDFTGTIFDAGPYHLGETYNAKFDQDKLPTISDANGVHYFGGFHYYRRMKDAKIYCGRGDVVIKILVKNVLATGTQNRRNAGVAEIMTLERISFDPEKTILKTEKETHKKFLKLCTEEPHSKILEFCKRFKLSSLLVKSTDMKEVADSLTKSLEIFVDFIVFLDCFPRNSKTFKLLTIFHLWAYKNHDEYKKFYYDITKQWPDNLDNEIYKKLTRRGDCEYELMVQEAINIDSFILNNI